LPIRSQGTRSLPEPTPVRVIARIESLAVNPRPVGCRKLQGTKDLWRVCVGNYRVIYRIIDRSRVIDVIAIRHRRDAYR